MESKPNNTEQAAKAPATNTRKAVLIEQNSTDENKGKDPQKFKIPHFYYSKNESVYNICLPHSRPHYVTYTFRHYLPHVDYSQDGLFTAPNLTF